MVEIRRVNWHAALDRVSPRRIRDPPAAIGREMFPQISLQRRDVWFGQFANGLNDRIRQPGLRD